MRVSCHRCTPTTLKDTNVQCSSTPRTTLERTYLTYLALGLFELGRIAMSLVCTYADVADPRGEHGPMDAVSSAACCYILATCSCLDSAAFHFGLGRDFSRGFRYGSVGVHSVYCDYCESKLEMVRHWHSLRVDGQGLSRLMLTMNSGFILVVSEISTQQPHLQEDRER